LRFREIFHLRINLHGPYRPQQAMKTLSQEQYGKGKILLINFDPENFKK